MPVAAPGWYPSGHRPEPWLSELSELSDYCRTTVGRAMRELLRHPGRDLYWVNESTAEGYRHLSHKGCLDIGASWALLRVAAGAPRRQKA